MIAAKNLITSWSSAITVTLRLGKSEFKLRRRKKIIFDFTSRGVNGSERIMILTVVESKNTFFKPATISYRALSSIKNNMCYFTETDTIGV